MAEGINRDTDFASLFILCKRMKLIDTSNHLALLNSWLMNFQKKKSLLGQYVCRATLLIDATMLMLS